MDSCAKHPHEKGVAICRRCGGAWCNDCLVYSFGERKPPFCMGCAMVAGGVRTAAMRPAMPKRELKALQKAAKAEAKAAAKAAKREAVPAPEEEQAVAMTPAPAPAADWETPWWEDREERLPTFAD
jgi:hypothetical protein